MAPECSPGVLLARDLAPKPPISRPCGLCRTSSDTSAQLGPVMPSDFWLKNSLGPKPLLYDARELKRCYETVIVQPASFCQGASGPSDRVWRRVGEGLGLALGPKRSENRSVTHRASPVLSHVIRCGKCAVRLPDTFLWQALL